MPVRLLVTDVEERAVLAVCRALAEAGYLVSGVAGRKPAAGHWSRSVDRRYTLPNPRLDGAGFVAGLAQIAAEGEHAVLIPGVDAALIAVSEHRADFEPHLRVGLPPHDAVMRSLDKFALFDAATIVGFGPPESVTCREADEAVTVARRLGWPVVLKPARSLFREEGTMMTSAFAHNEAELRALAPSFGLSFTVQRHEPGAIVSCGGVVADGALLGLCVSRYERTWPPGGGSASASITIDVPPDLPAQLESLLANLGWEGIFELELIECSDGRLAAIDFNPRPYGSLTLAVASGANLPALWCSWLLGEAPAPARSRSGVRYRWEEAELLNLLWATRHRRIDTLKAVLRPRLGTTHALFRLSDPAPAVARAVTVSRRRKHADGPLSYADL